VAHLKENDPKAVNVDLEPVETKVSKLTWLEMILLCAEASPKNLRKDVNDSG